MELQPPEILPYINHVRNAALALSSVNSDCYDPKIYRIFVLVLSALDLHFATIFKYRFGLIYSAQHTLRLLPVDVKQMNV